MKQATLLYLVQDDQILLAMKKRGFGADRYNGVGGKIEPGESIEEAAIRECQEEIGITPFGLEKVAHLTFAFNGDDAKVPGMKVHVFMARDWEGEILESEEMAPEWFYMDMIPYHKMWSGDIHWLPAVLGGSALVGDFTFDENDEVTRHEVILVNPERLP